MNKIIIKSRRSGINILQLKLENMQLKKEVERWKFEYEILDTCIGIYQRTFLIYKQVLKTIKRIIIKNDTPGLGLVATNTILDLINKALGENK